MGLWAATVLQFGLAGCAAGQPGPGLGEAALARSRAEALAVSRSQQPEGEAIAPSPEMAAVPEGEFAVRVRAKVNGLAILDEELKSAVYPMLLELRNKPEPQRSTLQKEVLQKALDQLIEREVILSEAFAKMMKGPQGQKVLEKLRASAGKQFDKQVREMKKRSGCKSDEEFKQLVAHQGQSLDGMRRQFERQMMATEYMRYKVLSVTDKIGLDDVRRYYEEHSNEFQRVDGVKWQDIFVSAAKHGGPEGARQLGEHLIAQLRAGADFAKLAAQHDDGDSSFRGGEGYGQRQGEIRPAEVEPHLFQMKDGDVGPLVAIETGVHVIRLVKREHAGLMEFDDHLQDVILKKLKNETAEREWKRFLKEMKEKAIIEVFP
jgi:parvulin-like peptidyl-prolyl isomerase